MAAIASIEAGAGVVRPGDKLVVAISKPLTPAEAARYRAALGERLPGVEVVIVDQASSLTVYRPDAA